MTSTSGVSWTDGVGVVVSFRQLGGGGCGVPPPLPGTVKDHPRTPAHPFRQHSGTAPPLLSAAYVG